MTSPSHGPLEQVHSHNDYERDRPLAEALEHGFTSVEADVWLVDGELYVFHEGPDPSRTLRSLYLDPLQRRISARRGRVFDDREAPIRLLVDVKTSGTTPYEVINSQLSSYPELITVWCDGRRRERAVTVVLSGEQANRVVPSDETRWCAFDGRIGQLPVGADAEQLPLVSENWPTFFTWQGIGRCQAPSGSDSTRWWPSCMPGATRCGSGTPAMTQLSGPNCSPPGSM